MRVIAIASGKGGMGKTNVTTNLSIALAKLGKKVSIIDADTSLGNINVLLNIEPTYTMEHLLNGEKDLGEILAEGPHGVKLIPAASGITELANLDAAQLNRLTDSLHALENDFDYLLIDTAAGISRQVIQFIHSAQYAVIVVSEEPTSLTDAFALVRLLQQSRFNRPIYILPNMVKDFTMSIEVYKRFRAITQKHLNADVQYLGYVPRDEAVREAVLAQQPVIDYAPNSPASRSFITIAHAVNHHLLPSARNYDFVRYWKNTLKRNKKSKKQNEVDVNKADKLEKEAKLEQVISTLVQHLKKNHLPLKHLKLLTHSLLDTSLAQYKTLPFDIRHYLYRHLRSTPFREDELHKLIMSLIALYEKQHDTAFSRSAVTEKQLQTNDTAGDNKSDTLELVS